MAISNYESNIRTIVNAKNNYYNGMKVTLIKHNTGSYIYIASAMWYKSGMKYHVAKYRANGQYVTDTMVDVTLHGATYHNRGGLITIPPTVIKMLNKFHKDLYYNGVIDK